MDQSFQVIICMVLGLACFSKLTNCTDKIRITEDLQVSDNDEKVTDPSAISNVFEHVGDITRIIEGSGVTRRKRNAIVGSQNHWTGGIVPYTIASTFSESEQRVILQSMKHWEECTCIRFRPKITSDIYSVTFMSSGNGCYSFVGRLNEFFQPQGINLGTGCVAFSVVVHEIGHALGFFHEHNREDRNKFIRVNENNIQSGFETAFSRVSPGVATTLGFGYDYASIMHYNPSTFAQPGTVTLETTSPNIHFGDAQELSPLDAAKANALYNCSARPLPSLSVIVPEESLSSLPDGITCGSIIQVAGSGTFTSPDFPQARFNEECAFVLRAPEGYGLSLSFPQFSLDPTAGCSEDYVQIYRGASVSPSDLVRYGGYLEGRICNRDDSRFIFFVTESVSTIYYRTNGRNIRSDVTGLQVAYDIRDIDECQANQRASRCHSCTNLPGSFRCDCRDGYYHSPAANTCFDVNECAFNNGGCAHICTNLGGSYSCSCNSGSFLQSNGLSCGPTPPSSIPQLPTPGTIIPKSPPSEIPLTTTTPPNQQRAECGGGPLKLTSPSGSLQTFNWPNSGYITDTECDWNIECPTGTKIDIQFEDSFRVAGRMPDCTKDQLTISDCGGIEYGPFCHLTRPEPFKTTCNEAHINFLAGSGRGDTRTGFKLNYVCTEVPTVSPLCGGGAQSLTTSSGSIQTLNWPNNPYPINTDCSWDISCPSGVLISFEDNFRVAGRLPECSKDQLIISGCDKNYGPFCHTSAPSPLDVDCPNISVSFVAGSERGDTRTGYKLNYQCK